jgi:hypothetical protein
MPINAEMVKMAHGIIIIADPLKETQPPGWQLSEPHSLPYSDFIPPD